LSKADAVVWMEVALAMAAASPFATRSGYFKTFVISSSLINGLGMPFI
jgi:hypothetical protein